ncbi:hypothetical protein GH714_020472 [Hevea brasiliensis]|uniref:Uncharacterized protein n=1 Tax=Hevea brasiliensis TaxID=3981 RepID=A0A6A6MNI7_HEVBR|nr:hypothetical protein GH714_020472 [Hevea brasiliensis]
MYPSVFNRTHRTKSKALHKSCGGTYKIRLLENLGFGKLNMGNEMGNNNTSGLREEDNTTPEAQGKFLQETDHNSDVKGENYVVPTTGCKDYHQTETGLDFDDPNGEGDTPAHNQTSDGTGQKETGVNPSVESAEAEKISNEEGGNDRDIQFAASFSKEMKGHRNPTSSENVLETSNNCIERQPSFKKEEEDIPNSTFVAISSAHDSESEDSEEPKPDQHEFTKVHAEQSEQDSTNSLRGIADVLGTSAEYSSKKNSHLLDIYMSDNLEGTIDSATNLDVEIRKDDLLVKEMASQEINMPSKEKFEVILSLDLPSNVGEKYGELAGKMNCNETNFLESKQGANLVAESLDSHLEASLPEDKTMVLPNMVLPDKAKLIGKESESGENKHDLRFPVGESNIEKANGSETDSLRRLNCKNIEMDGSVITAQDAASNGDCQIEEVKVVEESDNQEKKMNLELGIFEAEPSIANDENNEEESGDCRPEANTSHDAAYKGNCQVEGAKALVESDNQNESSEEHCNGPEGKHVMVHELGITAANLSIANGKNNEEEVEDFKPEALTAHEAATKRNCHIEEFKVVEESNNQNEAYEENCEESEGKIVSIPELGMVAAKSSIANSKINAEESGDCKSDEAYEGKIIMVPELVTVAAVLPVPNVTNNEEEAEDYEAEEEEPVEKHIVEIKQKIEVPFVPVEHHLSCASASLFLPENHQQETFMKSEDSQDSSKSTLELKPKSSNKFNATTFSTFHATSSPVESLVSVVELAIEKLAEEVLPQVTAAPRMATDTKSSASANDSSEQHEKTELSVFAKTIIEAQENAVRMSTESVTENLIQAEVGKSPSSIVESTVPAVQLAIEKSQQESPHYSITVLETVTQAKSLALASQSSEQCEKVETSVHGRGGYEPQETVGRFSTESISDNLNNHAEMRKSPSFNLDLRIEARGEESDQTPLLHEDKNAIEGLPIQADVSLQNSLPQAQYGQESLKYQAMPVEEKVITLERNDSEKSRTPFLGFLKEDEEARGAVLPKKKKIMLL